MHVGVPRLVGAPAGGAQRPGELLGDLADVDRELSALLGGVLVGAERAMDLLVDLLQGLEHRAVGSGPAVADQRGDRAGADHRRGGVVGEEADRVGRKS